MSGLTARQLAVMQAALEARVLPDTCSLIPITESVSSGLHEVVRATGVPVTYPCGFQNLTEEERLRADAWQNGGRALLKLPLAATPRIQDRILYRGVTYEIRGIEPQHGYAVLRYVSVEPAVVE